MARRKRRAAKKRKVEWSKVVCLLAMLAGLQIGRASCRERV